MRTLTTAFIAITLTTLFFASSALSATQNVKVSARVVGNCVFESVTDVNFGDLDPNSTTDAKAIPGELKFWCTKNASYTLEDPDAAIGSYAGQLSGSGTEKIPYTLTYDNVTGPGKGKSIPITSTISATIVNADYIDVAADTYTDTVTFTITP